MEFAAARCLTQTNPAQDELDAIPDLPAGFDYLWGWFMRLHSTRPKGFTIGAITETEIRSFFLNRGMQPERWEVDVIERLDNIALQFASEQKEGDT